MPAKNTRRGRPKGSGLDDHGQLVAIAALIDQDPELKPTTAIKSLGISDPSTIRRLRDKYRKFENSAKPANPDIKREFDRQPNASVKPTEHAKNLEMPVQQQHRAPRQPRSPKPVQTASEASLGEPASWLNSWTALGLQGLATTLDIQISACRNYLALPPIAYALKQQHMLQELAISFCKPQKTVALVH